jgi:hypothetical protein
MKEVGFSLTLLQRSPCTTVSRLPQHGERKDCSGGVDQWDPPETLQRTRLWCYGMMSQNMDACCKTFLDFVAILSLLPDAHGMFLTVPCRKVEMGIIVMLKS